MVKVWRDVFAAEGLPVAYHRPSSTLLLADLHLGFEAEMEEKGVHLPHVQFDSVLGILEESLRIFRPRRIVIVGDVKHSFSRLNWQERREVGLLFKYLTERLEEVVVVRGNHDNFLTPLAHRYGVSVLEEDEIDGILLVHGHKEPRGLEGFDLVVMGHEHPSIALRDQVGVVLRLPCFLRVPLDTGQEALVLPASGTYQSGNPVTLYRDQYLSPILRKHALIEDAVPIVIGDDIGIYELPRLGLLRDMLSG